MKKITPTICFISNEETEDTSKDANADLSQLLSAISRGANTSGASAQSNSDENAAIATGNINNDSKDAAPVYDPYALPDEYKL
ncbi:MAG: hypothetical protein K2M44_06305 [Clostridia bacterium]|nr:hypothetical protein [Clostridia bacterium]